MRSIGFLRSSPDGRVGPVARPSKRQKLAEKLGFTANDRLLIVNCDDLGASRATNSAIERALRSGVATSASLMVPCPWAKVAAQSCRDLDIGIHLTLTSEYPAYRWKSLTGAASLHDRSGYLPRTVQEVWARAELDDVEAECKAQIEQMRAWGIEPSHLNSHMDAMQLDRHYFEIYLRLAAYYRLPVRFRPSLTIWPMGIVQRKAIATAGVMTAERFFPPAWGNPIADVLEELPAKLRPGVTEIAAHPAADCEELRTYDRDYADMRISDAATLTDSALRTRLSSSGIKLVPHKALRDAMRSSAV